MKTITPILIILFFIVFNVKSQIIDSTTITTTDTSITKTKKPKKVKLTKNEIADSLFLSENYERSLKFYVKIKKNGDSTKLVTERIDECIKLIDSLYYANPKNIVYDSINIIEKAKLFIADYRYEKQYYVKAAQWYESTLKTVDSIYYITSKLAYSYKQNNRSIKSEYWYNIILQNGYYEPIEVYYYAEALKNNMKYNEAAIWLKKYNSLVSEDNRAKLQLEKHEVIDEILGDSSRFAIEFLDINSDKTDFGAALYGKNIIFSSGRKGSIINGTYGWNAEPFLDMYIADRHSDGDLSNVRKFGKELNTSFHEGPVCFTDTFKTIFFTRNNYPRRSVDGERVNRLKILKAESISGKWNRPKTLPFNSNDYSCGHPAFSEKNRRLYFVSDMPGGFGGTDLYYCIYKNDSTWGEPVNLGSILNTEGNEMFPFIQSDGTLYYSSDGLPGLGGLDIYFSRPLNTNFARPKNFGYPVNSSKDDFAFFLDESNFLGYLSSNRCQNEDDNMYKVIIIPIPPSAIDDNYYIFTENDSLIINPLENDLLGDCKFIFLESFDSTSAFGGKLLIDTNDKLVYYPKEAFIGTDTIHYKICDTLPFLQGCDEGEIFIHSKEKSIILTGITQRKKTRDLLDSVEVILTNKATNIEQKVITQSDGKFKFVIEKNMDYKISCSKVDYKPAFDKVSTQGFSGETIEVTELLEMLPYAMEGIVVYSQSTEPVKDVHIKLLSATGQVIEEINTKNDGLFYFALQENSSYIVKLNKDELLNRTRFVTTEGKKPGIIKIKETIEMLRMEEGAALEVEILFDLGKSNIRPDAAKILDEEVIQFLEDNPKVDFEFGAHTDARGSSVSNQSLSQKRAESSVNYMLNKGISGKRISAKGYGESKLKNHCKDGVNCSKEEHQANRRVEMKIVKFK